MMDIYEPNDSSAAAFSLNSGAAISTEIFTTTFHLSSDEDWFYWTTSDAAFTGRNAADLTRLQLIVNNPSGVPFTVTVEDLNYSETALQFSSAALSSTSTITTSGGQINEELWRMKIVPNTTAGWSLATCASSITFTIREY